MIGTKLFHKNAWKKNNCEISIKFVSDDLGIDL